MMSQTAKQIITTHISFNISRSKCYQTIRIGKLIEYKLINIFLINNVKNVLEKLVPGHYFEKLKKSTSLDQQSQVLYSLFLMYV